MTCIICDGSGLIPFKNKKGKIVPYAFVDCNCKEPEPEHYHKINPEDFDFACSETFRGYSYHYCGVPDPGHIPPQPELAESVPQEIIHRHSDISKKEFDLLQGHDSALKYLLAKQREKEEKKQVFY